jgi:hypothetical protein
MAKTRSDGKRFTKGERDKYPRLKEIGGFNAQYVRVLHALEIAESEGGTLEEKEYQLITFFLHCWHLKDHIKNDGTKTDEQRKGMVDAAEACPELQICQALADGLKHFLDFPRAKMAGNTSVTVVVGSHIQYLPRVELANGTRKDAIDIARDGVKAWQRIKELWPAE